MKNIHRIILLITLLIVFTTQTLVSKADTIELKADKDTFVYSKYPSRNYDNRIDLHVGNYNGEGVLRILIYFDISKIKGKEIKKATLVLNKIHEYSSDSLTLEVHKITEPWESATWDSQPKFEDKILANKIIDSTKTYYIEIPPEVLESNNYFGFLLKSSDENKKVDKVFSSSEYSSKKAPKLIVEYDSQQTSNKKQQNKEKSKECSEVGGECILIWRKCNGYIDKSISCGLLRKCCVKCASEGESLGALTPDNQKECCAGLKEIPPSYPSGNDCKMQLGIRGYCTKCGDGICKSPENKCNCPEDCSEESYSTTSKVKQTNSESNTQGSPKSSSRSRCKKECEDEDNGKNIFKKGKTTKVYYNCRKDIFIDRCINEVFVMEYYCNKYKEVKGEPIKCPAGYHCEDGACKKGEPSHISTKCYDSDFGNNPLIKGEVILGSRIYEDICLDSYTLKEYSCNNGLTTTLDIALPHTSFFCSEGKMVSSKTHSHDRTKKESFRAKVIDARTGETIKSFKGYLTSIPDKTRYDCHSSCWSGNCYVDCKKVPYGDYLLTVKASGYYDYNRIMYVPDDISKLDNWVPPVKLIKINEDSSAKIVSVKYHDFYWDVSSTGIIGTNKRMEDFKDGMEIETHSYCGNVNAADLIFYINVSNTGKIPLLAHLDFEVRAHLLKNNKDENYFLSFQENDIKIEPGEFKVFIPRSNAFGPGDYEIEIRVKEGEKVLDVKTYKFKVV